jgi:hypothetical protein
MRSSLGQSSINAAERHVHGANTGWVHFRPSSAAGEGVTETFLSGFAFASNFGWININPSCADFGVKHDGMGNLSG